MDKSIFTIYKIPFLISVTLSIVLLALSGARVPYDMMSIIVGAFLGMFILDMEYFLNAFVLDQKSDFSKSLQGFLKHSDWTNALRYIHFNKEDSKENSLNSALFQMVLACMSIFVVYSTTLLFAKALVLSVFAHSIYVLLEYYFKNNTEDWFWVLKRKPNKGEVQMYIGVLLVILSFCLYRF